MTLKHKPLYIQFAQYVVGGGLWFVSGYIIFVLCYGVLGWSWWTAKLLADIVGWTLNYLVQRYWAFNNPLLETQEIKVSSKYVLLMIVNTAVDFAIVGGLKWLGLTPFIGLWVAASFFTVWNYVWYKFWVFNPKS